MVLIRASAPNKLHLCGEHSVVYGGKALMAPVEIAGKRNRVTLEPTDERANNSAGIVFRFSGDLGSAWLDSSGQKNGDAVYFPLLDVASFICQKLGEKVPALHARLDFSGAPKGTGSSASLSVALALALFTHFSHVPDRADLYDAAFVGDNAYHGGKSSGGDVAAVLSDRALLFWREFSNAIVTPVFEPVDIHLPSGTSLVLVSSDRGGSKANTAAQIERFAKANGITKSPTELTLQERKALFAPFDAVVAKILSFCHVDGDAEKLGAAFDENHALLKSVTTAGIDEAIACAKQAGALGGKLVGAGGEGGALVVLVRDGDIVAVQEALENRGFESWPVHLANHGPSLG